MTHTQTKQNKLMKQENTNTNNDESMSNVKKTRGRPRKSTIAQDPTVKRPRGRPRKSTTSKSLMEQPTSDKNNTFEHPQMDFIRSLTEEQLNECISLIVETFPENVSNFRFPPAETTYRDVLEKRVTIPSYVTIRKPRSLRDEEARLRKTEREEITGLTDQKKDETEDRIELTEDMAFSEFNELDEIFDDESIKTDDKEGSNVGDDIVIIEIKGDPCSCSIEECLITKRFLLKLTSGYYLEPYNGWLYDAKMKPAGRLKPPLNLYSFHQKIRYYLVLSYLKLDLMYTSLDNWLFRFIEANVRYGKNAGRSGTLFKKITDFCKKISMGELLKTF